MTEGAREVERVTNGGADAGLGEGGHLGSGFEKIPAPAPHEVAMWTEQARQLREHLARYGDQMSDEARRRHSGRLIELERKEYQHGTR